MGEQRYAVFGLVLVLLMGFLALPVYSADAFVNFTVTAQDDFILSPINSFSAVLVGELASYSGSTTNGSLTFEVAVSTTFNPNACTETDTVTPLLSPLSTGYNGNGKTREENLFDMISDALDPKFNTTRVFNNGTDDLLWVTWFDSATACGLSNVKTYSNGYSCTGTNMTYNPMVSDEFSEVMLVLSAGNASHEYYFDAAYNTVLSLGVSGYGGLPSWQACADYTDGVGEILHKQGDSASDGTARIVKALYQASVNDDFSEANRTKYASKAAELLAAHYEYETFKGSFSSAYGTIGVLPSGGADCASGGNPSLCSVDIWVGYYYDLIGMVQAGCAREQNETYCDAADDYVKTYLSVMLQNDTDGDGWGVAPFNFNYDTSGSLAHTDGGSVNAYHYDVSNEQWDDSDAVRERSCDTLRTQNISEGNLSGVWLNLSNFCESRAVNGGYSGNLSCLQYRYNGTAHGSCTTGYYQNGLGALDRTYYNTTAFEGVVDEAIGHYSWFADTFDSSACGNALTYRGVRATKALMIAIGKDNDVYVGEPFCDAGTLGTFTQNGLEMTLNSAGNNSQTDEDHLLLNVTVVNLNVTDIAGPKEYQNIINDTADYEATAWGNVKFSFVNHSEYSDFHAYYMTVLVNTTGGTSNLPKIRIDSTPSTLAGGTWFFENVNTTHVRLKNEPGYGTTLEPIPKEQDVVIVVEKWQSNQTSRVCYEGSCSNWYDFADTNNSNLAIEWGANTGQRVTHIEFWANESITTAGNANMNVSLLFENGTVIYSEDDVANASHVDFNLTGLADGDYNWSVNVVSENNNETFGLFSFEITTDTTTINASGYNITVSSTGYYDSELVSWDVTSSLLANLTNFVNFYDIDYAGNITVDKNYVRNLTYEINFSCPVGSSTKIGRYVNEQSMKNTSVTCTGVDQTFSDYYKHSVEGNYSIAFFIESTYLSETSGQFFGNETFTSDLFNPSVEALNVTFVGSSGFVSTATVNVSLQCVDNIYPSLTYNLTFNGVQFQNGTFDSGTIVSNTTTPSDGENTAYGLCADPFGNRSDVTNAFVYRKTLVLIDEKENDLFDTDNVTSAKVYFDDNSSLYDFKNASSSSINFTAFENEKLRFELEYETGEIITRWVDVSLFDDGEDVRVCANKEGIQHYEQLIISAITRRVVMRNIYSDCVVAADYTRFAYQDALLIKAWTIDASYNLFTYEDDDQVMLASVDGSVASFINLDVLEFNADSNTFNIIGDSLTASKSATNTIKLYYNNINDDNEDIRLQVNRLDTNTELLDTDDFVDSNEFTVYFDYTTFSNITDDTLFSALVTKTNGEGETSTLKRYFTAGGETGILSRGVAIALSVLFLVFGLTFTLSRTAFSWFGIAITIGAIAILAFAPTAWYMVFLMTVYAIILVYVTIIMVNQNVRTIS